MTENIELKPLKGIANNDSDEVIEEYETRQDASTEITTPPLSPKTITEYDFFTVNDIVMMQKLNKKKKSKKKQTHSSIMDIVKNEVAASKTPIEKNVITKVDFSMETSCFEQTPQSIKIFRRDFRLLSNDDRWNANCDLSPIFPRVLGNTTMDMASVDIPVEYTQPTSFENMIAKLEKSTSPEESKFLDIEIKDLKYKHHHNFSLEKVLIEKLILVHREFVTVEKLVNNIKRDVIVNRETKFNLKQELMKISPRKKDVRFDPSLRKYMEQMIELKIKQREVLKKEKELINIMITLWSDVVMIREKSECIKTPYELEIIRNDLDEEEYQELWSKVFDQELNDLLDEVEFEFVMKYLEYKKMKRIKDENDSDRNKVKPKLEVDEVSLKERAQKLANSLVKTYKLEVKLKYNEKSVTDNDLKVEKTVYYLKFFVDKVYICESDKYINKNDFDADFIDSFSVQILPGNLALDIILYANGEEVAEISFNLSDIKSNVLETQFNTFEFVYNSVIEPNANRVGCGYGIKEIAAGNKVRLKSSNYFDGKLYTKCETNIKIKWAEKLYQNKEGNILNFVEVDKKIKRLMQGIDKANVDNVKEVIEQIYEQDISDNEDMIDILANICKSNVKIDDDSFDVYENSAEFVRIKLLRLRNEGEFSNIKNKSIPLFASQITTEQLMCLQKSEEKDFDISNFSSSKYGDTDPIELQRFIGSKYIEKLYKNLLKNLNDTLLKKTYKDVVYEYGDLNLGGLFNQGKTSGIGLGSIYNGMKGNRDELLMKEQEIHINIQRAFNLPDRTPSFLTEDNQEDSDNIAGYKLRSLRPFVKVSYQGCSAQTATAIGCHPTWNQTLKITTKAGTLSTIRINLYDAQKINLNESLAEDSSYHSGTMHFRCFNKWLGVLEVPLYTVLALGKIKGTFQLNVPSLLLGYESHPREKEIGRSLIPEVTQLLQKETSFITLQISTKTGLGFNHRYDLPTPNNNSDDYLIKHLNNFVTEYQIDFPTRNISLTYIDSCGKNKCLTQFLQPIPPPDYEYFPKNPRKSESAVSKNSNQSKSSSSKSLELKKDVLGDTKVEIERESHTSYEGRRYKNDVVSIEKSINVALRYVSLIPCYDVTESHVVTLMGVELLKILYGSPLDHTILLASYFLHLGLKTYIAIGLGLPRGPSSYVLTKYDLKNHRMSLQSDQVYAKTGFLNRYTGYIWYVNDAVTGECFELRDVSCPLKSVDYVFDNENIWVNIQSSQECESISFEFSKSSDWQQVFDKHTFVMKHPAVAEAGLYTAPVDVDGLRNALETKIKTKFQKWRSHVKTIWNRYCSTLLRDSLVHWEYWALNPLDPRPVLGQRMRQLMATSKVYGFPINTAYSNTKAVISRIKATSVHLYDDPNTEFSLGVEVFAYPNNVVSVWVFLASVTRI